MPKKRDDLMTVRIASEEKINLKALADHYDVTLSDVVIKGLRNFLNDYSAGTPEHIGHLKETLCVKSSKVRGEMMSVRIPEDEKLSITTLAKTSGSSFSKIVIKGLEDFLTAQVDVISELEASGAIKALRDELEEKRKVRTRWDGPKKDNA